MVARASTLLITYSPEILNGEPILISSNSCPVKAPHFEPAGHAFHSVALKLSGYEEEDADTDDQSVASDDKGQSYMPSSDSYSTKGKKKHGDGNKQQDHYALLGLAHLRFLATEEQIRKSYRETALKHHPDKQAALLLNEKTEEAKQAKKDEIESHFKTIQEAYEVLIDPVKRRIYDSTDEFDDEIPTDCAPQDFFKVFGPAFMRNGRWSVNLPVPSLGDEKTPFEEVDSFYDFWYSFKSWREFPHADEFDLEQAESRDHKRWMERQNAKLREKARKEEHARVRTLIDNAYKKDPRILRRKEEEKAEKKRRKESKFLAKKLQEEEAARAAEEKRRQKEDDDRKAAEAASNQKKQKEKEKKLLRKERTRFRALLSSVVSKASTDISEDVVEGLCMSLEMDRLRSLCDEMEGKEGNERSQVLLAALNKGNSNFTAPEDKSSHANGSLGSTAANGEVKPVGNVLSNYEKKERPWGKEEVELLRKGINKYPKGTSRRWEVVSEYMGTGRSVQEILKATKTVLLQKPDSSKAFDSFLEKRKPAQPIASPLTTRAESDGVPASGKPEETSPSEAPTTKTQSVGGDGSSQSPVTSNGVVPSAEEDTWSAVQDRALLQAYKTFPKESSQRWERISAAIPGKTVNHCKKRLTFLKESLRSKKNAN